MENSILLLDETSFEELYTVYYSLMCMVAYEYLRDQNLAEDIVDEVFLNLWNHKTTISIDRSPKHYLIQATKNQCLQHIRQHSRGKTARFEDNMAEWHIPWADSYPLGDLIESELAQMIEKGMGTLPKQCAIVFRLSREEQASYKEIAKRLGISENTVKFHMKTALTKLRIYLSYYLMFIFLPFI